MDGDPASKRKIVSQLLIADAELRDIVLQFVDALPSRIAELKQAYAALDWEQLALLAHRLKGASGSYGYPELSTLAAAMEQAFRAHRAEDFAAWLAHLEAYVAGAKAGLEDSPASAS